MNPDAKLRHACSAGPSLAVAVGMCARWPIERAADLSVSYDASCADESSAARSTHALQPR
eukprot:6181005-Pleurochrysis_carterae.AAC.4